MALILALSARFVGVSSCSENGIGVPVPYEMKLILKCRKPKGLWDQKYITMMSN